MAKGAKERWLEKNYASVKVSLEQSIVLAFKEACKEKQQSQASVLKKAMINYIEIPQKDKTSKKIIDRNDKRPKRKKNVANIIAQLEEVLDAEQLYCDGIPDNFANRKEAAEETIARLEDAINNLIDAY